MFARFRGFSFGAELELECVYLVVHKSGQTCDQSDQNSSSGSNTDVIHRLNIGLMSVIHVQIHTWNKTLHSLTVLKTTKGHSGKLSSQPKCCGRASSLIIH